MRNRDIYIERYNNGERNFKREVTVFNEFEIEELLGEERTKILGEEIAAKAFNRDYAEYTDITRITLDLDDIQEELEKLKKEILDQAPTVSGDDDVFDYFPDLVYAFEQICEYLDKEDFLRELLKELDTFENTIGDDQWISLF